MLLLAAIFMGLTFVVFVIYGAFAALMRDYVITRPDIMRWIRQVFAGTFAFLSMRLAFSDK